jgi:endonuclease/exonuclease/phosphatase family metal-dependent hydrolase
MDVPMKFAFLLSLLVIAGSAFGWSVSTYNIRNFDKDPGSGRTNLQELSKILKEVQSDVMAFEEIVNVKAFEALVKKSLPGYAYAISSCGGSGEQHLAFAYNPKTFDLVGSAEDLSLSDDNNTCGSLRPLFLLTLKNKANRETYIFGAVHLKAGGNSSSYIQRWEQYEKLEKIAKANARKNLIFLGDFNSTGYILKDRDFEKFESFINDSGMRSMTETLGCTNYWEGPTRGREYQASILDHIVITDKNVSKVQSVKVGAHCAKFDCRPTSPDDLGPSYKAVSDHCPVQVTFK